MLEIEVIESSIALTRTYQVRSAERRFIAYKTTITVQQYDQWNECEPMIICGIMLSFGFTPSEYNDITEVVNITYSSRIRSS